MVDFILYKYKKYGEMVMTLRELAHLEALGAWPEVDLDLVLSPVVPLQTHLTNIHAAMTQVAQRTTEEYFNALDEHAMQWLNAIPVLQEEVERLINAEPITYLYCEELAKIKTQTGLIKCLCV